MQQRAGASFLSYGPAPEPGATGSISAATPAELVETFGEYEAEYAAIRKGVGIFVAAQRGLVEVSGKDRIEFLHRMLTNDTRQLQPGQSRRALLLSKQGRIMMDMIILHQAERTWLLLDRVDVAGLLKELDKYLFTEDVKLRDASDDYLQIALHGPKAGALLVHLAKSEVPALENLHHATVTLNGEPCIVSRFDETGSIGLHVIAPVGHAASLYQAMADAVGGLVPGVQGDVDGKGAEQTPQVDPKRSIVGRGIGWLAFNTARVEAGRPLFHIDFGPDSLPAETGLLDETVSFTKGCYLGQEVVARMQHLGHPKRKVVALRGSDDRLPIAGSQVFEKGDGAAKEKPGAVIGAITSSTLSPLGGNVAIALATIKWGKHLEGTELLVPAEGAFVVVRVANTGAAG
ncbi:MAG: hypothetical protein WD768_05535 [Phycisphaeraceae bacterium]